MAGLMNTELLSYLDSFRDWESCLGQARPADWGLERVHRLLEALGHPEDRLKFVHIAGTKGKGSTAAFLASILRACGYRVGLYTSPHLHSWCERIRILSPDGTAGVFEGMIPEGDLAERCRFYRTDIERLRREGVEVTLFEYLTAVALTYFAREKVDVVVLEAGLGGRLDATNAVDTMACAITPIGLEHTHILGATCSSIATEKAAVIKAPSQKVVLAPQAPEVMEVLKARCAMFGITPDVVGETICSSGDGETLLVEGRRPYRSLRLSLRGGHQVVNMTTAIALAEGLELYGFVVTEEAVRQGVSEVFWPARFEEMGAEPRVIVDCAHTPEAMDALAATFYSAFPGRSPVVVLGMSSDKRWQDMIAQALDLSDQVILTRAQHPRALDPAAVPVPSGVRIEESVPKALSEAFRIAGSDGIILVCGSVFVAAEAREYVCQRSE
ncbi:MAG: bifunctional folylpolyglutamate synthase/dihydrofolate synthase [Elusimicrobia bacterium]|nr:bifunctional folylpolyglutamate synthase/dihydrofolate synthase [Elusimicrobiota bacterium]